MNYAISDEDVAKLNEEFAVLVKSGQVFSAGRTREDDHLDMPGARLYAHAVSLRAVRRLIDRINMCEPRRGMIRLSAIAGWVVASLGCVIGCGRRERAGDARAHAGSNPT